MCGRYALTQTPRVMRDFFGYAEQPNFPPRYNIAPTQPIAVVHLASGRRAFNLMRWGLLPGWVKDTRNFPTLVNARAESAADKAAFRAAMRHRRCPIPADGFYEWQKSARGQKVPHFIRQPDGRPFAFGGLWESYLDADGGEIDTAAILTTAANCTLAPLHERMPVVIEPEHFDRWLDCEAVPPREIADVLKPARDDFFEAFPISTRVNAVANDDPSIQEPLADEHTPPAAAKERPGKSGRGDPEPEQMKLF